MNYKSSIWVSSLLVFPLIVSFKLKHKIDSVTLLRRENLVQARSTVSLNDILVYCESQ